jgi:hypothetical protein
LQLNVFPLRPSRLLCMLAAGANWFSRKPALAPRPHFIWHHLSTFVAGLNDTLAFNHKYPEIRFDQPKSHFTLKVCVARQATGASILPFVYERIIGACSFVCIISRTGGLAHDIAESASLTLQRAFFLTVPVIGQSFQLSCAVYCRTGFVIEVLVLGTL